jgi:hypothetical protein
MANTVGFRPPDALREQMRSLVGQLDAGIPRAFTLATKAFLTAMEYDDIALMRSRLEEVREALTEVVREAIQKRLGWPQVSRKACRKIMEIVTGEPNEDFDEPGKEIESHFDKMLKDLTDLRDGPVKSLQEHGYSVENASELDRDIAELQELKRGVLEDWPWSEQKLPPVDRKRVAESRAAFHRKEGERIEDLISRLGGDLATHS